MSIRHRRVHSPLVREWGPSARRADRAPTSDCPALLFGNLSAVHDSYRASSVAWSFAPALTITPVSWRAHKEPGAQFPGRPLEAAGCSDLRKGNSP